MESLYDEAEWVVLSSDSTPLSISTVRLKNPGDGPRVLLIHGNPGTLDDFSSLIPHLSFASEVAAFDLPGFGKSPPPVRADKAFSLAGLAKVALALADQMGWQRFDVIGHSHGAGVAQAMAWHRSFAAARLSRLPGARCLPPDGDSRSSVGHVCTGSVLELCPAAARG